MKFLEELLFIVGLSFLASIITAKLLSMVSGFAADKTLPASGAVTYVEKHDKESAVAGVESEKGIFILSKESAKVNDRKEEEFMKIEKTHNEEVISDEVEVGGVREISIEDGVGVGGDELAEQVFDQKSEIPEFDGIEKQLFDEIPVRLEFIEDEENVHNLDLDEDEERNLGNVSDEVNKNEEEEGWLDDWEGIERTELEKRFGAAVAFMGSESDADRVLCIASDVKMELFGLHKVAIEGPCTERMPMALKVSARAKW